MGVQHLFLFDPIMYDMEILNCNYTCYVRAGGGAPPVSEVWQNLQSSTEDRLSCVHTRLPIQFAVCPYRVSPTMASSWAFWIPLLAFALTTLGMF